MLKSNFLLLFFLLSCAKESPTLLSRWESKSDGKDYLSRQLASDGATQCLKDLYSIDTVKKQIDGFEKRFASASPVLGKWRHLDLSTLPVPQANFLKTFGQKLGDISNPNSIDYSSCQSVPCIFNKIYGKEEDVGGYVHYLWYLKFGSTLAADNVVPNQVSPNPGEYNGKPLPLASYLYTDLELYGFWRLAQMLEPLYTTLTDLKEIQRIPKGEKFEGKYVGACGLSHSLGWIILTDQCLEIRSDADEGYFYPAVVHEMSHQIDFAQGNKWGLFWRSHEPDYLAFTGMSITEYAAPTGEMVRTWKMTPGTKVVTPYAGTAPQENFAESLSYFRNDGDMTIENITPEHFNFVSQNYFRNQAFTGPRLISAWQDNLAQDFSIESFKMVKDCSQNSVGFTSTYLKSTDFEEALPVSFIQCLGARAQEISLTMKARVLLSAPEACQTFKKPESKVIWNESLKINLLASIKKNITNLKNDQAYFAVVSKAYDLLKDNQLSRDGFFACSDSGKICYDDFVKSSFQQRVTDLKAEDFEEILRLYLSKHSFEVVSNDIKKGYIDLVSSFEEKIRQEAGSLWKSCRSVPVSDVQPPTGNFFLVSQGYLASSINNCVNSQYVSNLQTVLKAIEVDGKTIENKKEERFISDIVQEKLKARLQQLYEVDSMEEQRRVSALVQRESERLLPLMKSDLSWLKGQGNFMKACQVYGLSQIPVETTFFLKKDLVGSLLNQGLCLGLSKEPALINWFNQQKQLLRTTLIQGLNEKMYQRVGEKAHGCLAKYPKNSKANYYLYKIPREVCVNFDWDSIESNLISETREDPVVQTLELSSYNLREILGANRSSLKARISLEYLKPN
jgi:HJR/Mrr/RecB family endonuclease